MAYMSQEKKKALAPAIKAVLKKYDMKGTIAVRHHSTLVVNIKEGQIDLIGAANKDNKEYSERTGNTFYEIEGSYQACPNQAARTSTPVVKAFFKELTAAAMMGNHNNSDIMTDYFDVGWYVDFNIGSYDKPYVHKENNIPYDLRIDPSQPAYII